MKMMSRFRLRFLLAGCALAMGIGVSSSAMAMPNTLRCVTACSDWFSWNPTLAAACAYGCNGF